MKVKIKTWDEMAKEFGLDTDGDIKTKKSFNEIMEGGLPEDRIIDIDNRKNWEGWNISEDMIAEYIDDNMDWSKKDYDRYIKYAKILAPTFEKIILKKSSFKKTQRRIKMEKAKELVNTHWKYIKALLETHGEGEDNINIINFYYKKGFLYGYEHAIAGDKTSIENLVNKSWEFISEIIKVHDDFEPDLRLFEFHYRTALEHGYKHGLQEMEAIDET